MTITTDLKLPTTCPCCGAGVRREVLDQETGGPTLTRVYGRADALNRPRLGFRRRSRRANATTSG